MSTAQRNEPSHRPARMGIGGLILLILGAGAGIWVFSLTQERRFNLQDHAAWVVLILMTIGGVAAVGPPLLLIQSRKRRTRWGAGRVLWFSEGAAAWLLWPPVIRHYVRNPGANQISTESLCFYYGTPLMAVYMLSALYFGGWIRRRRRFSRRFTPLDWRDRVGLIISLLWACTGLYVLGSIYWQDWKR